MACWVAFSCDVLADIADFISIDAPGYRERADRIRSKVDGTIRGGSEYPRLLNQLRRNPLE